MTNGYYYAAFDEVTVQCYDPPQGANINGTKSYVYTGDAMTNNTVAITNKNTILQSFLGTGTNMSADYPSNSATASGSAKTSEVATVPGLTGAGTGNNGQRGDNTTSSGGDGGSGSGSPAASASGSASTGFVQGDGGNSNGAGAMGGNSESMLKGSVFAVVVALVGLCVL